MGIEPTRSAWEAEVLPLNYTRRLFDNHSIIKYTEKMHNQSLRIIKSFVRRDGRFSIRQQTAFTGLWSQYGLQSQNGMMDFTQIFGRKAPLILEVGFGMGNTLLSMALDKREHDFIGIEVHRPGVGALLANLKEHDLNNVRVFCEDAVTVLSQCIGDNALHEVFILFPDPWPKRRHHKRRLIESGFISLLTRKLCVGGQLHLATDWEDYAKQMMRVLTKAPGLSNRFGDGEFVKNQSIRPITKFEKRGQSLGHKIYDLSFVKL